MSKMMEWDAPWNASLETKAMVNLHNLQIATLDAEIAKLKAERDEARRKASEYHRRMQDAEAQLHSAEKRMETWASDTMARLGARAPQRRIEALEREIAELKREVPQPPPPPPSPANVWINEATQNPRPVREGDYA